MTTDVSTLDDSRLFAAEDGLHKMYALRKSAGEQTADIETAFDALTLEMSARGLVYDPLAKGVDGRRPDANHYGQDDGDDDPDDTNDDRADPDGDGGNESPALMSSAPDSKTKQKIKGKAPQKPDGPVVKKDKYLAPSVPLNAGTHPTMDDGLRQKGKTKSGKGGESGRTQRKGGKKGSVSGKNKTFADDGLVIKKRRDFKAAVARGDAYVPHLFVPMEKDMQGHPFHGNQWIAGLAAVGAAYGDPSAMNANAVAQTQKPPKVKGGKKKQLAPDANWQAQPHDPAARAYKKDADGDDDGDKKNSTPNHRFLPVRNICRVCRQPMESHLGKQLGWDMSMFKAVADDTVDDRKAGAEAGMALPDGSFYIPDEAHLHQAIRLVAQAPDPQAAMNHIIERAQAMGLEAALPPAWRAMTAAGQPQQPAVGPGANTMAASQGAGSPPGMPGSKQMTAPGAAPAQAPGQQAAGPNVAKPPKPKQQGFAKRLTKAMAKAFGAESFDADTFESAISTALDPSFEYAVVKSSSEERFTLGPVYMPNTLDAHGEWATAEDLQKSLWDYVAETGGDRTVYLQHSPQPAGQWVELVSWPQEVNARMVKSVDGLQKAVDTTFPAGTVYMGVVWEPWAYEDVKKGRITGFSMGGYARRVDTDIPL